MNAREAFRGQTALMWAAAENHAAVVEAARSSSAPTSTRRSIHYEFPKLTGGNGGIIHDRPEGRPDAADFRRPAGRASKRPSC